MFDISQLANIEFQSYQKLWMTLFERKNLQEEKILFYFYFF